MILLVYINLRKRKLKPKYFYIITEYVWFDMADFVTVKFTADRVGTYPFFCTVFTDLAIAE